MGLGALWVGGVGFRVARLDVLGLGAEVGIDTMPGGFRQLEYSASQTGSRMSISSPKAVYGSPILQHLRKLLGGLHGSYLQQLLRGTTFWTS